MTMLDVTPQHNPPIVVLPATAAHHLQRAVALDARFHILLDTQQSLLVQVQQSLEVLRKTRKTNARLFQKLQELSESSLDAPQSAPHPSMLTEEQWQRAELLFMPKKHVGRPTVDMRRTIDGIRYVQQTGCAWRRLPPHYGSYVTCWRWWVRWEANGFWKHLQQCIDEPS